MAKTNFQYEKRQRELEKKKKADEKARRKQDAKQHKGEDGEAAPEEGGGEVAEPESDAALTRRSRAGGNPSLAIRRVRIDLPGNLDSRQGGRLGRE